MDELRQKYAAYVTDPKDAHIVAGAVAAQADFLIIYNSKHFEADKIKTDLGVLVLTPAQFLQYLRSK